jgi:four helix bundle protein
MIQNFRDLKVWQLGKRITVDVYRGTSSFPRSEEYGLGSQLRRAAVSIPSNIAEGFNRNSRKDFCRFLYIALGSCSEVETQIEIGSELGLVDEPTKMSLGRMLIQESKMIRRLISKLERKE